MQGANLRPGQDVCFSHTNGEWYHPPAIPRHLEVGYIMYIATKYIQNLQSDAVRCSQMQSDAVAFKIHFLDFVAHIFCGIFFAGPPIPMLDQAEWRHRPRRNVQMPGEFYDRCHFRPEIEDRT